MEEIVWRKASNRLHERKDTLSPYGHAMYDNFHLRVTLYIKLKGKVLQREQYCMTKY